MAGYQTKQLIHLNNQSAINKIKKLETFKPLLNYEISKIMKMETDYLLEPISIPFKKWNVETLKGGISKDERIKVEDRFKQKKSDFLFSTSIMELGIDVAHLNFILMMGFPNNHNSYLQRAGRAGRRNNSSVIVTFLEDSPTENILFENINELFNSLEVPLPIPNRTLLGMHEEFYKQELALLNKEIKAIPKRKFFGIRDSHPIVKIVCGKYVIRRPTNIAISEAFPGAIYYHKKRRYEIETIKEIRELRNIELDGIVQEYVIPKKIQGRLLSKEEYITNQYRKPNSRVIFKRNNSKEQNSILYGELVTLVDGYYTYHDIDGKIEERFNEIQPLGYNHDTEGIILFSFSPDEKSSNREKLTKLHSLAHSLLEATRMNLSYEKDYIKYLIQDYSLYFFDAQFQSTGIIYSFLQKIQDIIKDAKNIIVNCNCEKSCVNCLQFKGENCLYPNIELDRRNLDRLLDKIFKMD